MITKTIHFFWCSEGDFPPLVQQCIASWKKHCPDYKIRHWTMADARAIDNVFLQEALDHKKWAFAADFIRFYAVYHEGGIYLDTDVELYQSLDPLLHHDAFIGRERSIHYEGWRIGTNCFLTSHAFGAIPHHPFFKLCLSYYDDRHFVLTSAKHLPATLKYDQAILPYILSEIARQFGYNPSALAGKTIQTLQIQANDAISQSTLIVFPNTYFDAIKSTQNSFGHHHALGSWRDYYGDRFSYTLSYKIKWRLLAPLKWLIEKFFDANVVQLI